MNINLSKNTIFYLKVCQKIFAIDVEVLVKIQSQ